MDVDLDRVRLQRTLAASATPYELFPCDPALADTAAFCAAYGFDPADSANTIVIAGKAEPRRYAACVVLAPHRLDVNRVVRVLLGTRRASFAAADETRALTGMEIGGVTPFGLPPDLPLWVDARVMTRARIVLGGGSRSWKVIAPPHSAEQGRLYDLAICVIATFQRTLSSVWQPCSTRPSPPSRRAD